MAKPLVNTGIADRVNLRMRELNISRTILSRRSGITTSQVGHICSGRIKMTGAFLAVRLADALQCDLRWLITGEGEK